MPPIYLDSTIKRFGAHHGSETTVEVDILFSKNKLGIGDTIDDRTMTVYELKATEGGYITAKQRARLDRISSNIVTIRSGHIWDRPNNMVVKNPKVLVIQDLLRALGLAAVVGGSLAWTDLAEAKMGEVMEAIQYPGQFQVPEDKAIHTLRLNTKIKEFADALGISAINDDYANGIMVLKSYRDLGHLLGNPDKD